MKFPFSKSEPKTEEKKEPQYPTVEMPDLNRVSVRMSMECFSKLVDETGYFHVTYVHSIGDEIGINLKAKSSDESHVFFAKLLENVARLRQKFSSLID